MAAGVEPGPRRGLGWAAAGAGALILGGLAAYAFARWFMAGEPSGPIVWVEPPAPEEAVLASAVPVASGFKNGSQQRYLSGVIFFQKGDYKAAAKEWEAAARLDPKNADIQAALRRLRIATGRERR